MSPFSTRVASIGITEARADEQGIDYVVSRQITRETAFGWAIEDTDHFVKIIADAVEDHPRRSPDRATGIIHDPGVDTGYELRAACAPSGPRSVSDPSCDDRVIENALLGLQRLIAPTSPPLAPVPLGWKPR